jgi:hypothetical protein
LELFQIQLLDLTDATAIIITIIVGSGQTEHPEWFQAIPHLYQFRTQLTADNRSIMLNAINEQANMGCQHLPVLER